MCFGGLRRGPSTEAHSLRWRIQCWFGCQSVERCQPRVPESPRALLHTLQCPDPDRLSIAQGKRWSYRPPNWHYSIANFSKGIRHLETGWKGTDGFLPNRRGSYRSEERRVGKEWN